MRRPEASAAQRWCAAQSAALALTWPRRMRILLEAAQGMLYLHSMSPALLLRDLKSANLLVTRDWTVKVSLRPADDVLCSTLVFPRTCDPSS